MANNGRRDWDDFPQGRPVHGGFIATLSMSDIKDLQKQVAVLKAAVLTIATGLYGHILSEKTIKQIIKDLTE